MKRHVCYVSGTRADFGLMERTLVRIHRDPRLQLSICVTGMHLSPLHGETVKEIQTAGLPIGGRIMVDVESSSRASMAKALGSMLIGMTDFLGAAKPDIVLLLGDRGEMLAGAISAIHLNIPIAHIHGGERSGTVDEPVRHAISKLAHYHFVATQSAGSRLIQMGERQDSVHLTGAPGLDDIIDSKPPDRRVLCAQRNLDPTRPVILLIFHPVLQDSDLSGSQMTEVLRGVTGIPTQILCFTPNSDAGHQEIRDAISRESSAGFHRVTHMSRSEYLAWLGTADAMVGNSSSGIIEAASFGLPVINIGERQACRDRNPNTVDVPVDRERICVATTAALARGRFDRTNIYGDGHASERIAELLATLPLGDDLLRKRNAY